MNFFKEVWVGYRPYLVKFTIDFLVTASLWMALFIFKYITKFLPITGWAGDFIVALHSAGVVGAVGVFVWLSLNDIIHIRGGRVECFAW